ncbi:hypothetical protein [Hwangdonia lutea]|uniref:Lipoprotein n=1 Tax=Hwangdonia lutea TaxID=3075823 RepID=A0AA97EQD1_9FLAO|nr:hypothetical protein [Hwangdonia sp. SCSIO 19198]WOD44644.1 hypothetical protein RNZ46_05140 [Hwangdonia sp. SCSIO 19198]
MKALKITLLLALLLTAFTSCTKQDLNEDDVLNDGDQTEETTPYTGGGVND